MSIHSTIQVHEHYKAQETKIQKKHRKYRKNYRHKNARKYKRNTENTNILPGKEP
jgi:hypothetical protein